MGQERNLMRAGALRDGRSRLGHRFPFLAGARQEPADQGTEKQPGLRRKGHVGHHADEDSKSHADHGAHDHKPHPPAISSSRTRHCQTILASRDHGVKKVG
jgi:hypothetical protein